MPSRGQKTSVRSSYKSTQGQRSCAPNHDHPPSNYRFSFGSFGTKVISVCGWRFAPACCSAQSVIRRGPGCAVPLHRLPWAAVNSNRRNELHRSNVSAKGNENLHLSGFNWRQANQAARPNWSLNRTLCGGPGLGFKSLAQTRPAAKCRLASTLGFTDTNCALSPLKTARSKGKHRSGSLVGTCPT